VSIALYLENVMNRILIIIPFLLVVGCAINAMPQKDIAIAKIVIQKHPEKETWEVTDIKKINEVRSTLKNIAPVRKELLHGSVTYVPLNYYVTLFDSEGHGYYYQLSSDRLRSQKATWPISEQEYQTLANALGIKEN
jgi:hypothetical protein